VEYFEALILYCMKLKNTDEFKKAIRNLDVLYDIENGLGKP